MTSAWLLAAALAGAAEPAALHVRMRETTSLAQPDATAAWAIDATLVEVALRDGQLELQGLAVGATRISVLRPSGVETRTLVVDPPLHQASLTTPSTSRVSTRLAASYDSESAWLTNRLDIQSRGAASSVSLAIAEATRTEPRNDGLAVHVLPVVSLVMTREGRELALFDRLVSTSALSLQDVTVRGVHLRNGPLALHAGYAAPYSYRTLLLPADREAVVGIGYRLGAPQAAWVPAAYWFDTAAGGGASGLLASLSRENGSDSDPLHWRAELAFGRKLGFAAELERSATSGRLWLSARHQPAGMPSLGIGRPHGTFVEGLWSAGFGDRLTSDVSAAHDAYQGLGRSSRNDSATGELRMRLGRLVASAGASLGAFSGSAAPVRAFTAPIGLRLDLGHASLAARGSYHRNSASDAGGLGGRLTAGLAAGPVRASGFIESMRQTATLSAVYRDVPGLARALAEAGLGATSVADLATLLREETALERLGVLHGLTIDPTPSRLQTGGDLALVGGGALRPQLTAHALFDRSDGLREARRSRLLGVAARVSVLGCEASAGVTWWSLEAGAGPQAAGRSLQFSLSRRFAGAPAPWRVFGDRSVAGSVYLEDRTAAAGSARTPLADVELRLDGGRSVRSDARGHYRFDHVGAGVHRVEAVLPPETYFTTPSAVTTPAGGRADFGLASATARLLVRVVSDASEPLAGVVLQVSGPRALRVTTDTSGEVLVAVPAGAYGVTLEPASLAVGYAAGEAAVEQRVSASAGAPGRITIQVRAQRSIAGRVVGGAGVRVWLVEADRSVTADETGAYLFRAVAPGTYTVRAETAAGDVSRSVVVPAGPAALRRIDLGR